MDQMPQEIMHSLFSFDHSMENRGHLYPYNYHYGQYPYHYPYPYPHPSSAHTNIPSSHGIASSSAHHLAQASQSLVASQINLSPYSSAVHGIRPTATAMREQMMADGRLALGEHRHPQQVELERHHMEVQHTAEDLRSVAGDARNTGDGRYYPLDMRPLSSEQRYPGDLRPLTSHTRPSAADYRHVADYSSQPTDLRTQPLDARLLGDMRQLPEDGRVPLEEGRGAGHDSSRHSDELQHKGEAAVMSRATENNYKYLGEMRSCANQRVEELQLPSGDPRPPLDEARPDTVAAAGRSFFNTSQVSTNENRLPANAHDPLKSMMNQHYYDDSSSLGLSKPLAMGEDLSAKSSSQDPKQQLCDPAMVYAANTHTEADPGQVGVPPQTTDFEGSLQYPAVNTSNNTLGLLPHGLAHHRSFQEATDCDQQNDNSACMNKCVQPPRNAGYGGKVGEGGTVPDSNGNVGPQFDLEDDFDSEASSSEYSDSFMDFSEATTNEASSNSGEPAKPFQCEECDATFTTKGNLKVHQRIHTGERPYQCEECGKTFSYCASYQSHKLTHSGLRPFKCEFCHRAFFRSEHLERHRRRHTGERPFKCTECNATFAASDGLSRHTRTHTGERPYHCQDCGLSFAYKSTFMRHQQIHIEGEHKCDTCGLAFQDPQRLEKHKKKHTEASAVLGVDAGKPRPQRCMEDGVEVMQCEFCQMKFKRKSAYYFHRRSHTGEKPFACDVCGASFVRGSYLEEHMRTHTGERPFSCDSCESAFKTRTALRFHLRTHSGERPFKCDQCDFAFTQKSAMKAHMRIHTGDKPFKCHECKAAFRHSNSLTVHKRTHTGERPFVCDTCGSAFTQKSHLNLHKRSHSGIKPHMCDECNASFTKKDYLLAHKTKHAAGSTVKIEAVTQAAGDSAYKCSECDMVFTHPSSLTVHARKHTGERPFVCAECGASFLYSSNLTTHRRKHTGERPYKCDQCEAAFILKSYLTMHLRKHSGERPFKCDECQACFTQKTHLSTHRRIHTGECPYKCEECGEAFRDGANFWRHKKKHLIGEGAATIRRRRSKKGRGRGRSVSKSSSSTRGRNVGGFRGVRTGPPRRAARVPRLSVDFDEIYEQLVLASEEEQPFIKEEPGDTSNSKDDEGEEEDAPYIPINPMVEIKLEGEEDNSQYDLEEGDMIEEDEEEEEEDGEVVEAIGREND